MPNDLEFINCNLCEADAYDVLYDFDPYKVVRCKHCGLMFVNPRLKEEAILEFYKDSYFNNSDFYSGKGKKFYGFAEYEESRVGIEKTYTAILEKIEAFKQPGRLLEIGSAYGYFLNLARQNGWKVSGIELSQDAAAYCREHFSIEPYLGNLDQFSLLKNKFDLIVFFDVIEHMHDPAKALKAIHSMLEPGGLIAFSFPNSAPWVFKLIGEKLENLQRAKSNDHLFFFQKDTMAQLLDKCGFKLIQAKTIGRSFALGHLSKRLQIYNKPFFSFTTRLIESLNLQNVTVAANPGLKLIVYAEKRA